MTFILRLSSSLSLHEHFQVLALDGVYVRSATGALEFRPASEPTQEQLEALVSFTARCVRSGGSDAFESRTARHHPSPRRLRGSGASTLMPHDGPREPRIRRVPGLFGLHCNERCALYFLPNCRSRIASSSMTASLSFGRPAAVFTSIC